MAVPLIDAARHHASLASAIREAFDRLLASGQFVLGATVSEFESALAAYCGAGHAIGVSSGTDALVLALMALEIKPGDEVITTPFTFFATAGSIARVGARPVFVDIEPDTFNLDPDKVEAAITRRTRAIMPVHLFGQCAAMRPIMEIARSRNLAVIEDAAQAIGAMDDGKRAGSIGHVGCLSFYPTKNLSALGDAGACVTNDADLAKRMTMLRVHGESQRYHHDYIGGNFRIDAIQAAALSIKLPHLDGWTALRQAHARRYETLLSGLPITLPRCRDGAFHVYNQYTIRVAGEASAGGPSRRDALREHLTKRGIGHGVYYPVPLHLQKCFAYLGYQAGDFPVTEAAAQQVLSLPIFPEMTEPQQEEVADVLREFFA